MTRMPAQSPSADRRYWVWITGPEYYLDSDGTDRDDLEPSSDYLPGGWWTCHKDTKAGDLILLYRSRKRMDLAYLIEARSAAYSILDDAAAKSAGWDYGCDYQVLAKFDLPLSLAVMKADPVLREWGALRAGFRRRVYEIPPDIWTHLLGALGLKRSALGKLTLKALQLFALESQIEEQLAGNLAPFTAIGLDLDLRARQYAFNRGGRLDLLCWDRTGKRYVVVELKRGQIRRDAFAQLKSYMASVREEFPVARKPIGLLVGTHMDNETDGMVRDDSRVQFVKLGDLGIGSEVGGAAEKRGGR